MLLIPPNVGTNELITLTQAKHITVWHQEGYLRLATTTLHSSTQQMTHTSRKTMNNGWTAQPSESSHTFSCSTIKLVWEAFVYSTSKEPPCHVYSDSMSSKQITAQTVTYNEATSGFKVMFRRHTTLLELHKWTHYLDPSQSYGYNTTRKVICD